MMDCASVWLKCDAFDLNYLSDCNENRGVKSSAWVPLLIAIDLVVAEVADSIEKSEVVAAGPEVNFAGAGEEFSG